jgi:hypothetical protein
MVGEFEVGNDMPDVKFTFGSERHDANLVFERAALTRFVELASRMLDLPPESDPSAVPTTMLVAHYGYSIRATNRYATCSPTPAIGVIVDTELPEPEVAPVGQ